MGKQLRAAMHRIKDVSRFPKKALCKVFDALGAWFRLLANIKAKNGIQNCDTCNFDEAGSFTGQICAHLVATESE